MGGMVLETNMTEIMTRIEEQNRLEKSEVGSGNRLFSLTYNRSMFFLVLFSQIVTSIIQFYPDLQLHKAEK